MKPRIQKLDIPEGRRVIAISDVHGRLPWLRALLDKCAFSREDTLILLGDFLEKGEDSLGTLRYVMELCGDYDVHPVMGNCDEWDLAVREEGWVEDWVRRYVLGVRGQCPGLLAQMCGEAGFGLSPDMDMDAMRRTLREGFPREFAFLAGLPHIIETEDYTFVHGGLPEGPPESWDAWHCMKNDDFMNQGRRFEKWVIVGHWPVVLYGGDITCANPIVDRKSRIVSIDGGCVLKDDGQLNALILPRRPGEDFSFVSYDDFPLRRVETGQRASERSAYIRYGDNVVEVLVPGGEFSRCRHVRTGYELDILTKYLRREGDAVLCNDCTDYALPLEAGDVVSVVEETSRGALVKRNGVSGWYWN